MTREEIEQFAEHLRELCMSCKHTPERCFPSACNNSKCYLYSIRNLHQILKDRKGFVDQLLIGNRRTTPTKDNRVSNQVSL